MSDTSVIEFAAETHPGNRYQHNEDSLGWSEDAGVWLIADGMGGHACGDIASRTAKQAVLDALSAGEPASDAPLTDLISQAHDAVVSEGIRRDAVNMGSTIAVIRFSGASAEIGWCGDSRVYLWRDGQLVRLTRDHSLLEQLLESGLVQPEEAFGHPQKHVLVQALGITNPPPVPAQLKVELASDDMLLMCSDGLHDELRDEDISSLLLANPEPDLAVAALVKRVLAGPARDNVSVVCMRLSDLDDALVIQPPLSVAQLRERFERLPGRRTKPIATPVTTPAVAQAARSAAKPVEEPVKTPHRGLLLAFAIAIGVGSALAIGLLLAA